MLVLWFGLGASYALILTPAGRLVARAAGTSDRSVLFATQYALTQACWFVAYLTAGMAGAAIGIPLTFLVLAAITVCGLFIGTRIWPANRTNVTASLAYHRNQ